jgi:hypothetical protein
VQQRYCSNVWFVRSVCPSISGWKAEDSWMSTPRSSNRRCQNLDANWGPLSDTISSGSPCSQTIPSRINWAVSSAMIDLEQGVKWAILVSQSTTTNIEFLVLTVGRSVMKSIAIDPQGRLGIDRGCRSPNGRCLGALDRTHVSQDLTYSQTSGELQDKTSFIDPSISVDLMKGCSPYYFLL